MTPLINRAGMLVGIAALLAGSVNGEVFDRSHDALSLEELVSDWYQREFGVSVPRPAIFNDFMAIPGNLSDTMRFANMSSLAEEFANPTTFRFVCYAHPNRPLLTT